MRSFPSRLANSVTRTVLLVPCLLICLACATPFPVENLEEGMTMETVREKFGKPRAAEATPGGEVSCWTYWHEEQKWIATSLIIPTFLLVIPINALSPGVTWDAWYLVKNSVFLHFEEEKLVSWEAIEPIYEQCAYGPTFTPTGPPGTMEGFWQPGHGAYPCLGFLDPPTCELWRTFSIHSEPGTSCEPERTSAEGRAEVGDTRYVARNYVSLWLEEPTASSNGERISVSRCQPLKILGRRGGWCRVEDNVGTKGWVGCVFLESKPH